MGIHLNPSVFCNAEVGRIVNPQGSRSGLEGLLFVEGRLLDW